MVVCFSFQVIQVFSVFATKLSWWWNLQKVYFHSTNTCMQHHLGNKVLPEKRLK